MITLRPYQTTAVEKTFVYLGAREGNPLVVLPTGSGKSVVLGSIVRHAIEAWPSTRVLVLTHRSELIEQDASAIRTVWPEADVGIYSASLGRKQVRAVTVAGVQSFAHASTPHTDITIVDEAHLIPHGGEGQYRTVIDNLLAKNPAMRLIGLTATPFRLSGGRLTRGDGALFSSICYELPVQQLVDEGYLSPLVSPTLASTYDVGKVATRGGDYAAGELGASIEAQSEITDAALDEAMRAAGARASWLVYCVSVEHARQAAQRLFSLGVSCSVVTGEDEPGDRRRKIERFKAGETRALVSVDVLTTGFDVPRVDCIVLLRPTQSAGLYVQICGRGMRLFPGKTDCLVLDFGGNVSRHGPITDLRTKHLGPTDAKKHKVCAQCDAEVKVHKIECPECGYVFPRIPREVTHEKEATRLAIMGPAPLPEWRAVNGFSLARWEKRPKEGEPAKPPTVVVTYYTGNLGRSDHREWVCPEHGGFAGEKFRKWWSERGGALPYPVTVEDTIARESELHPIDGVMVEKDGAFERVSKVRFGVAREPGDDEGEPDVDAPWVDDGEDLPF